MRTRSKNDTDPAASFDIPVWWRHRPSSGPIHDVGDPRFAREAHVMMAALRYRLVDRAAAMLWADAWIQQLAEPPPELFDVSDPRSPLLQALIDAIAALIEVPPPRDHFAVTAAVLHASLARGKVTVEHAARTLVVERGIEGVDLPDDMIGAIDHIDYGFDLAASGTHGTIAAVRDELLAFTQPFAEAWAAELARVTAA
ncbi:MAG: hypothetical protein K8W52_36530 [Deltaproteobacteria bacterium]|nr:hypothetical protein [Deltaproteobacteria bacterium]